MAQKKYAVEITVGPVVSQQKLHSPAIEFFAGILSFLLIIFIVFIFTVKWRSVARFLFQNQYLRIPERHLLLVYILFWLTSGIVYFPLIFIARRCTFCETKWFHKNIGTAIVQRKVKTDVVEIYEGDTLKTKEEKSTLVNTYMVHCLCAECRQEFYVSA